MGKKYPVGLDLIVIIVVAAQLARLIGSLTVAMVGLQHVMQMEKY